MTEYSYVRIVGWWSGHACMWCKVQSILIVSDNIHTAVKYNIMPREWQNGGTKWKLFYPEVATPDWKSDDAMEAATYQHRLQLLSINESNKVRYACYWSQSFILRKSRSNCIDSDLEEIILKNRTTFGWFQHVPPHTLS